MIINHNFGCGTLDSLPDDLVGGIIGKLRLDVLIKLLVTSKGLRQRLEEPAVRPGLIQHLPTIHRTWGTQQARLVEVIEEIWLRMGCLALGYSSDWLEPGAWGDVRNPMYVVCEYPLSNLGVLMNTLIRRTLRQRLLALGRAVDEASDTSAIPQNLIMESIAIEKLVTEHNEFIFDKGRPEFTPRYYEEVDISDGVIALFLRLKEHFSPRLFRAFRREERDELGAAFFSLVDARDDQEKNKELAMFLLKNCGGFLLGLPQHEIAKIEGLLGAKVEELSTEYQVFGSHGLEDTRFFNDESFGFQDLYDLYDQIIIDQTSPLDEDAEKAAGNECYEFVGHLVRVSKYVFTDADKLKHFLLWVSREACKQLLLEKQRGRGLSTKLCQETTARFEKKIEGIITEAIAADTTPFCAHTEFEHNTPFVYGCLGAYLVGKCTAACE